MSARVVDGNDPVTGHIISTTIGGKNGEPKQVMIFVNILYVYLLINVYEDQEMDLIQVQENFIAD